MAHREHTITSRKTWAMVGTYCVTVEYSDTDSRTYWRMLDSDGVITKWYCYNPGILWLKGKHGLVGYMTNYWDEGYNVTEQPFLITLGCAVSL